MTRSRYPRRGHRLAPATLRELLQVPMATKYLPSGKGPGALLCELDETTWERFDRDVCGELAMDVVRAVGRAARMPMPIADRHLPAIPEGMVLADLDLEVRTLNCLISAGIHERPQDLPSMTIEGILGLRGFWVKSLVDLLTSLEYVIDHPEARKPARTNAIVTIKHLRAAHRYPRPSHRLAPQTLKELLLDPIPPRLASGRGTRGAGFNRARLCDLDETAWEQLSPTVIGRLAGMIVSRAAGTNHYPLILQRRLPRPPEGMRLEDLRLENRTHNCLEREGFGTCPERMADLTVADLLSFRAFGSKCLVDLLTSLETRVAREGKLDGQLTAEAEALSKIGEGLGIQFSDPRLGSLLRAMDTESNTIGEMVERLIHRRLDPPDPLRLCEQLVEVRTRIGQLSELPLEEELVQIFAPGSHGAAGSEGRCRDRQIVAEYYGWDGDGGHTLEELGQRYGLSRERIRQVCVRAIKRNRDTRVFAPVLDRALAFLSERFPKELEKLQAEFDAAGFSACGTSVESVRRAGEFLGRRAEFAVVDVGRGQLVTASKHADVPRVVVQGARHVVSNYGAARTADVVAAARRAEVAEPLSGKIDLALVRETLQARDDFSWLDAGRNWFRLDCLPQYGLPNMIEKVLAVVERIDVSKLRTAMARYRRSSRTLPPPKILLEFCRHVPDTRVEGNAIISDPPRDWRKVLVGVERCMVEVLTEHGPVLERTAFEEYCVQKGVNRFSFNAIVMCSPVITQYGRSVYGLLGLKVDRKVVEELVAARSDPTPNRVLKSFGQTGSGGVFLVYQLSKAAISGGVITVPAAMRRRVRGKFTLRTDQGHKVGTLVAKKGCGWGLGPALRRRDAQKGDHMLLLLDTAKRQAEIRVGDEKILDGVVDQ